MVFIFFLIGDVFLNSSIKYNLVEKNYLIFFTKLYFICMFYIYLIFLEVFWKLTFFRYTVFFRVRCCKELFVGLYRQENANQLSLRATDHTWTRPISAWPRPQSSARPFPPVVQGSTAQPIFPAKAPSHSLYWCPAFRVGRKVKEIVRIKSIDWFE